MFAKFPDIYVEWRWPADSANQTNREEGGPTDCMGLLKWDTYFSGRFFLVGDISTSFFLFESFHKYNLFQDKPPHRLGAPKEDDYRNIQFLLLAQIGEVHFSVKYVLDAEELYLSSCLSSIPYGIYSICGICNNPKLFWSRIRNYNFLTIISPLFVSNHSNMSVDFNFNNFTIFLGIVVFRDWASLLMRARCVIVRCSIYPRYIRPDIYALSILSKDLKLTGVQY